MCNGILVIGDFGSSFLVLSKLSELLGEFSTAAVIRDMKSKLISQHKR